MRCLEKLEHSLQSAIVDTLQVATEILHKSLTLGRALERLGSSVNRLHNASNDSRFTVQLPSLLAVKGDQGSLDQTLRQALEGIVFASTPRRLCPHEKVARKKEKRWLQSKKHQSRSLDSWKQEQIRAERAAKRTMTAKSS